MVADKLSSATNFISSTGEGRLSPPVPSKRATLGLLGERPSLHASGASPLSTSPTCHNPFFKKPTKSRTTLGSCLNISLANLLLQMASCIVPTRPNCPVHPSFLTGNIPPPFNFRFCIPPLKLSLVFCLWTFTQPRTLSIEVLPWAKYFPSGNALKKSATHDSKKECHCLHCQPLNLRSNFACYHFPEWIPYT